MEGTYTGNKKVSANKESSTRNINISGIISLNGWNKDAAAAKLLPSCPTLCDPIDSSPPGSSVPWILQARMLEWVAISFSNARMHACWVASDSVQPYGQKPTRLFCPRDSLGKNTVVGCHFLLLIIDINSNTWELLTINDLWLFSFAL